MNQLFMQLYLDEDVDILIAALIRARGFTATTTQEAHNIGSSDEVQLTSSVKLRCAFLTHNRIDFEKLAEEYFVANKNHCGIIIAVRRTPYEIARRLLLVINEVTASEMKNQIRYI
jgi:hypothetical protein